MLATVPSSDVIVLSVFCFLGGWLLAPDVYSAGLLSLWSQTAVNRGEDEE